MLRTDSYLRFKRDRVRIHTHVIACTHACIRRNLRVNNTHRTRARAHAIAHGPAALARTGFVLGAPWKNSPVIFSCRYRVSRNDVTAAPCGVRELLLTLIDTAKENRRWEFLIYQSAAAEIPTEVPQAGTSIEDDVFVVACLISIDLGAYSIMW